MQRCGTLCVSSVAMEAGSERPCGGQVVRNGNELIRVYSQLPGEYV